MTNRGWVAHVLVVAALALATGATGARADSTLLAWGYNNAGQLGDGTMTDRWSPVQVAGLTDVIEAAGGYYHSVALRSDGTVWAWGENRYGQLGDGTRTNRLSPVQVVGLSNVVAVACYGFHSVALRADGTVWCWGANIYGEIGDGTTDTSAVPVRALLDGGVTAISAGIWHTMARRADGSVWVWGWNYYGQLGLGTEYGDPRRPQEVPGLRGVVAVACHELSSMALKLDGTVWSWGYNAYGTLGDGTTTTRLAPVQVLGISDARSIAAGCVYSGAIRADGSVWTWGDNGFGELGDGTQVQRNSPVLVSGVAGLGQFTMPWVSCLAIGLDGTAWGWGDSTYGQLGDGTNIGRLTPGRTPSLDGLTRLGKGYSCAFGITYTRPVTSLYAPNRAGVIGAGVALKGYLRRLPDLAWLGGRALRFSVNGVWLGDALTDGGGMAALNWVIDPGPSARTIKVEFEGDSGYAAAQPVTATLTAETVATKVYVVDRSAKVKAYTVLKAYLFTAGNSVLTGKPMTLKLDGAVLVSGNTNTSGCVQVGYTVPEGAGAGARVIRGEFAGDAGYLASANTGALTVTHGDLYIWPYVRTGKVGTSHALKAYVRSLPDYVIQPGKEITFKVDGSVIGATTVWSDGWATLAWSIPADETAGAHAANAAFAGDSWYQAASVSTAFNVVP